MDDDLRTALAAGDPAAYERAYDRYGPALFRTAVRLLGDEHQAEDAVQEVFAALVRSRRRLAGVADLKAYLFAALRHAAGRIGRGNARCRAAGLDDAPSPEAPPRPSGLEADDLWRLADRLPAEQKDVLVLKIQGELTFREVAAVCGISPNTAASRYRYALGKLKAMLESER